MTSPLESTNWFIGTMGFSFQDWTGNFYPSGLSKDRFLSYYSRFFNSVEIDSTFYGTPNSNTVNRWKSITPPEFKISVKMPRSITHEAGLIDVEYETKEFVDAVRYLDEKLGVVLIQLPPFFSIGLIETLDQFLEALPVGTKYAVEVRNRSWFETNNSIQTPILVNILRKYNNVCWAATEFPDVPNTIFPTADFLYIRWIGKHGTFSKFTEVMLDRQTDLRRWILRMNEINPGINTIYGYFNNDFSGFSPQTANDFKKFVGLDTNDFRIPIQTKLL